MNRNLLENIHIHKQESYLQNEIMKIWIRQRPLGISLKFPLRIPNVEVLTFEWENIIFLNTLSYCKFFMVNVITNSFTTCSTWYCSSRNTFLIDFSKIGKKIKKINQLCLLLIYSTCLVSKQSKDYSIL